ncbi:MAG TPA: hypothetical protein VGH06_05965 [Candidatus Udaeobacter sp.]
MVKKWIWRAVKGVLLLALILVLGLTTAVITRPWWQREWAPRHCEANLVSHWPLLKLTDVKRDSAFDLLQRAVGEQPKISGSVAAENFKELKRSNVVPWSAVAFPNLTRTLAEGAGALALARSAASAPNPQVPTSTSPADRSDYLIGVLRLNQLFCASAAQRISTGDIVGAYAELETAIAFARILSRGGALINALVDITCESQVCWRMRQIALQNNVPPEVAGRAINYLLESDKSAEPLSETFRQEYRVVPTMVNMLSDPRGQTLFGFDEEKANSERQARWLAHLFGKLLGISEEKEAADLADVYRCLVNLADRPYNVEHLPRFDDSVVPPLKRGGLIRLDDPVGYVVAKLTVPVLAGEVVRYRRRAAELRATAVVLALRQYQQAEQHSPQTLQDLVPKYLSEVPVDPFDGKPLRYRVRTDGRWIVYSVGPNQLDENGEQPKGVPRKYTDPGDVIFCECEPERERERLKIEATSK